MSRVGVIITDLFEDSEYTQPADAFRKAGHEVVNVGPEKGKTVTGKKDGTEVTMDKADKDVTTCELDALLIPGGY